MSQLADQFTAEETAKVQDQVSANVLARLQGALQSANDKKANLENDIAELQAEITARTAQPSPEQPQVDENGNPVSQG